MLQVVSSKTVLRVHRRQFGTHRCATHSGSSARWKGEARTRPSPCYSRGGPAPVASNSRSAQPSGTQSSADGRSCRHDRARGWLSELRQRAGAASRSRSCVLCAAASRSSEPEPEPEPELRTLRCREQNRKAKSGGPAGRVATHAADQPGGLELDRVRRGHRRRGPTGAPWRATATTTRSS